MKKNILAIMILAATLVNITLVAIMLFTLNPYVKRANELITRVCSVIDLELESPSQGGDKDVVPLADRDPITVMEKEACSLKSGADGKSVFAQVTATVSLNKQHEDYAAISAEIEKNKNYIIGVISKELVQFTADEIKNAQIIDDINKECLNQLQEYFGSKCIFEVSVGQPLV